MFPIPRLILSFLVPAMAYLLHVDITNPVRRDIYDIIITDVNVTALLMFIMMAFTHHRTLCHCSNKVKECILL